MHAGLHYISLACPVMRTECAPALHPLLMATAECPAAPTESSACAPLCIRCARCAAGAAAPGRPRRRWATRWAPSASSSTRRWAARSRPARTAPPCSTAPCRPRRAAGPALPCPGRTAEPALPCPAQASACSCPEPNLASPAPHASSCMHLYLHPGAWLCGLAQRQARMSSLYVRSNCGVCLCMGMACRAVCKIASGMYQHLGCGSSCRGAVVLPVPAQVKRIELALANGTLASITPAAHPHLWRAAQVGQPAHLRAPAVTMSMADAQRARGLSPTGREQHSWCTLHADSHCQKATCMPAAAHMFNRHHIYHQCSAHRSSARRAESMAHCQGCIAALALEVCGLGG